jgi:hypothetical protein
MIRQREATMPANKSNHLRRFWVSTALTVAAAVVIAAVVAATAGPDVGRIVLVSMLAVTSAVTLSDGLVAVRRRNRARR